MFAIVYLYWVLYIYFNILPFFFFLMVCLFIQFSKHLHAMGKGKTFKPESSINLSNVHLYFQKKLES